MKLLRILRTVLILIVIIVSFLSCLDNSVFVNCDECYSIEPDSGDLIINLTIENPNNKVPLVIYKGQVDGEKIEYTDTAFSSPYYLYVDLNDYYSVKAKYQTGDKTVYVVDGDKIKTKLVSETCGTDCWVITGGILDAKLKKF
jgi:hypothetical protein